MACERTTLRFCFSSPPFLSYLLPASRSRWRRSGCRQPPAGPGLQGAAGRRAGAGGPSGRAAPSSRGGFSSFRYFNGDLVSRKTQFEPPTPFAVSLQTGYSFRFRPTLSAPGGPACRRGAVCGWAAGGDRASCRCQRMSHAQPKITRRSHSTSHSQGMLSWSPPHADAQGLTLAPQSFPSLGNGAAWM